MGTASLGIINLEFILGQIKFETPIRFSRGTEGIVYSCFSIYTFHYRNSELELPYDSTCGWG